MKRSNLLRGIRVRQQAPENPLPERRMPVDAYGPSMKGYGASAVTPVRVPTPVEAWLSCVGAVMPFHTGRTLMVTPSSVGSATWGSLQSQVGLHLPRLEHCPLPKSHAPVFKRSTPFEKRRSKDPDFVFPENPEVAEALRAPNSQLVPAPLSSVKSPLASHPAGCADGVIFANGSFAEMVHESPRIVSDVHRVLKPRGVMCIVDHQIPTIVCGDTGVMADVARDFSDFCEMVRGKDFLSLAEESTSCAHLDTYLPFAAVNRRVLTSEFDVPLSEFIRYIETWPCFRKAMTPVAEGTGVYRRNIVGEPLEMFEWCTAARLRSDGSPLRLRLSVNHFVITCSNRAFEVHDSIGEERSANLSLRH